MFHSKTISLIILGLVIGQLSGFTQDITQTIRGSVNDSETMLNNKVLAASDFMTGDFPAEYGNSNAWVFDLKMRNGNNEKHEFSAQVGNLGAELMAEGPMNRKGRPSYLVAYRYSTLSLFQKTGIDIGTDAVKPYQDLNYKINLPNRNQATFHFLEWVARPEPKYWQATSSLLIQTIFMEMRPWMSTSEPPWEW